MSVGKNRIQKSLNHPSPLKIVMLVVDEKEEAIKSSRGRAQS